MILYGELHTKEDKSTGLEVLLSFSLKYGNIFTKEQLIEIIISVDLILVIFSKVDHHLE